MTRRIMLSIAAVATLATPVLYAETLNCTAITSLPYTINLPGTYCLNSDLTYSVGDGIAISVNSTAAPLVLDLNGHSLAYDGPGGLDASWAIRSWASHLTVRNGAIRGFYMGVQLFNTTSDSLIEDLQIENSVVEGVVAQGKRHVVRRCRVSETGVGNALTYHQAIHVYGPGHRVLDNDVTDTATTAQGGGGIVLWNADDAVVEGNRVVNTTGPNAYAITTSGASGAASGANILFVGNRLSGAAKGIFLVPGTSGKYRDNLSMGVALPYSGGIDTGNNQ
jgi:hypothetical protein